MRIHQNQCAIAVREWRREAVLQANLQTWAREQAVAVRYDIRVENDHVGRNPDGLELIEQEQPGHISVRLLADFARYSGFFVTGKATVPSVA